MWPLSSEERQRRDEPADHAADHSGDGHPFAAPFAAGLADLIVTDDAEDDGEDGRQDDNATRPMIPSTSEATQNPLLAPAASRVVPSMVKGMPQVLQLLAVMGERDWQRGQMMDCLPPSGRKISVPARRRRRRRERGADPA